MYGYLKIPQPSKLTNKARSSPHTASNVRRTRGNARRYHMYAVWPIPLPPIKPIWGIPYYRYIITSQIGNNQHQVVLFLSHED
jgi:hypothetical protein